MYRVENLTYRDILHITDLHFSSGRSTAVTGSSGAGKTTLLKLLDGLYLPDSGQIFFDGQDIRTIKNLRRRVTMAAQSPVIYEGDVSYNLKIAFDFAERPVPDDPFFKEVLRCVHLDVPLDHDTKMLSGGEQSRLCLARILALKSETYLIDEPTSALDENTQLSVMRNLLDFTKAFGSTVILVTHSPESAQLCDHHVELKKGGGYQWIR